jgi:hypothetical protein
MADLAEFLKRTKRVWLTVAGAIFGLLVMVTLMKDLIEWVRDARERQQEQAVASVTPDSLIARCGPPAEDMTREVYPILMRTISYQPSGKEKVVVAFSRTAEEKSDWVFLSMKDQIETRTYDSPEAKIAALPCLDSMKPGRVSATSPDRTVFALVGNFPESRQSGTPNTNLTLSAGIHSDTARDSEQ